MNLMILIIKLFWFYTIFLHTPLFEINDLLCKKYNPAIYNEFALNTLKTTNNFINSQIYKNPPFSINGRFSILDVVWNRYTQHLNTLNLCQFENLVNTFINMLEFKHQTPHTLLNFFTKQGYSQRELFDINNVCNFFNSNFFYKIYLQNSIAYSRYLPTCDEDGYINHLNLTIPPKFDDHLIKIKFLFLHN